MAKACVSCGTEMDDDDRFCASCGTEQPEIAPPAVVANAAAVTAVAPAAAPTCPQCGTPITVDMRFCESCGARLSVAASPAVAESAGSANTGMPVGATQAMPMFAAAGAGATTAAAAPAATQFSLTPADKKNGEVPPMIPAVAPPAIPPALPPAAIGAFATYPGGSGSNQDANTQKQGDASRRRIIAVVCALLVLLAVGLGVWWFALRGSGSNNGAKQNASQTQQNATAQSNGSSKSPSTAAKACTSAPDLSLESVDHSNATLIVTFSAQSNCASKNAKFAESGVTVTIKDGGDVVASAVYDFSHSPISFSGGTSTVKLAFTTMQYWRPYDAIRTSNTDVTVQPHGTPNGTVAPSDSGALGGANIDDAQIESNAQSALNWQLDNDADAANQFYSTTTTQLSSKKKDLQAEGKTWQYRDIMEQFLQMRIAHPKAILIWASKYSYYTARGFDANFYVILSGESFGSADEAKGWCSANGLTADNCMPVQLS
ncbi:zinc ribbon domain-containing protein [Bifidobacterium tibiigranuli]|nr:zinc ribbon domain-containing protein [Bifidobacterium tibiigranuli]MCI1649873.1 zinc ribbon domain-containing protein [Bifidobacterium tibiigranuli]MCI1713230.1 zinc ribbon domain-containing protein [Bifidobacterium tibiigranuli]MCI1834513.1 zinc ribbon domain-containing protein [Bifidobacterium tibiigranuli]MCI2184719.1 zinc ribbon domain-containing protein [Bifidobacterium tibiigranuli]MCI2204594.1 zinc ribbon domain-containing protein [Bifidobacterium tibiigranuli]